jgi:hypothetical protein
VLTPVGWRIFETLYDAGRDYAGSTLSRLAKLSFPEIRKLVNARKPEVGDDVLHRGLRELQTKRAAAPFDLESNQVSRRRRGDPRGVTTWLVRSYEDHLAALRDDPNVGRVGNTFFVQGKGRRLMTPAELQAWGITDDEGKFKPESEAALARAGARALPLGVAARETTAKRPAASDEQQRPVPTPVARAGPAPPGSPPNRPAQQLPFTDEQIRVIADAMDAHGCPATDDEARFMLMKADENPETRIAEVPADEIPDLVARCAALVRLTVSRDRKLVPMQIAQKMPRIVKDWRGRASKRERAAAAEARWQREKRVGLIVQQQRILENSNSSEADKAFAREFLEASTPEEIEAATQFQQRLKTGAASGA